MTWILHLLFLTSRLQQMLKRDPRSSAPSQFLLRVDGPFARKAPKPRGQPLPGTALSPGGPWTGPRPPAASPRIASVSPRPRDPLELKTGCALRPVPLNNKLDIFQHGFSDSTQIHFSSWATNTPGVSAVASRKVLCCVSLGKSLPFLSTQLLTWGWK